MANLQTLQGISDAREALFNKLEQGEVTEQRAREMERILRGQVSLKGELPLKAFRLITSNKKLEAYAATLAGTVTNFLGQPALTE